MKIVIYRADAPATELAAESFEFRSPDGNVTVLPGHAAYASTVLPGVFRIRSGGAYDTVDTHGGLLTVSGDVIEITED